MGFSKGGWEPRGEQYPSAGEGCEGEGVGEGGVEGGGVGVWVRWGGLDGGCVDGRGLRLEVLGIGMRASAGSIVHTYG